MAKGGNGKAQANGHENANENFANGMCENGAPNENAAKGLENALSHNPFECGGTVIDFDSGVNTVTYDYGYYITGTYAQDGYTLQYYSYDWYYYNSGIANPLHDADGSGDNEFGFNGDGDSYYYYSDAGFTLTADDGSAFSLDGMDILYNPDGSYYYYEYLYVAGGGNDGSAYSWSSAYTYDNVNWYTYDETYDSSTGSYNYEYGYTSDVNDVLALFDDQTYLYVYTTDDFAVDNLELGDLMAA